jgi:hypothetical protein
MNHSAGARRADYGRKVRIKLDVVRVAVYHWERPPSQHPEKPLIAISGRISFRLLHMPVCEMMQAERKEN